MLTASRLWLLTPDGELMVCSDVLGRIEPLGPIVPVPGAPAGIAGIAEVRGRVVTLLDPLRWLFEPGERTALTDARPGSLPLSALVFSPPHERLALLIPAGSTLRSGEAVAGEHRHRLLSREALTARIAALVERVAAI